jgi:menaquinone-dependent protoporphyrinogen oxidase
MKILVTYASKHGATRAIAERLATRLEAAGHDVDVQSVSTAAGPAGYDAVVIGSAVYFEHWEQSASAYVQQHRGVLAGRPVWLFSSGPLGTEATDDEGNDLREAAEPKEIAEFRETITPRDHHVFFGALDPASLGLRDRLIRALPAGRALLPQGDFRDWPEIDAWAESIAGEVTHVPAR